MLLSFCLILLAFNFVASDISTDDFVASDISIDDFVASDISTDDFVASDISTDESNSFSHPNAVFSFCKGRKGEHICCDLSLQETIASYLEDAQAKQISLARVVTNVGNLFVSEGKSESFASGVFLSPSPFSLFTHDFDGKALCRIQQGPYHLGIYSRKTRSEAPKLTSFPGCLKSVENCRLKLCPDSLREVVAEESGRLPSQIRSEDAVQVLGRELTKALGIQVNAALSDGGRLAFHSNAPIQCEMVMGGRALQVFSFNSTFKEVSERKSPRHVMKRQVGRGGNLSGCKNEQLRETIRNMLEPLLKRLKLKLGDVAKRLQKAVEKLRGRSFEVIMTKGDFVVSSNQMGEDSHCRSRIGETFALVYETPVEYDINDTSKEDFFASIDFGEPFGSSGLPGQKPFPKFSDVIAGLNNGSISPQQFPGFKKDPEVLSRLQTLRGGSLLTSQEGKWQLDPTSKQWIPRLPNSEAASTPTPGTSTGSTLRPVSSVTTQPSSSREQWRISDDGRYQLNPRTQQWELRVQQRTDQTSSGTASRTASSVSRRPSSSSSQWIVSDDGIYKLNPRTQQWELRAQQRTDQTSSGTASRTASSVSRRPSSSSSQWIISDDGRYQLNPRTQQWESRGAQSTKGETSTEPGSTTASSASRRPSLSSSQRIISDDGLYQLNLRTQQWELRGAQSTRGETSTEPGSRTASSLSRRPSSSSFQQIISDDGIYQWNPRTQQWEVRNQGQRQSSSRFQGSVSATSTPSQFQAQIDFKSSGTPLPLPNLPQLPNLPRLPILPFPPPPRSF